MRHPNQVFLGGKILVVDDDYLIRQLVRATLENSGCTVFESREGISAINDFAVHKPDVILLDVMMPGKSGFEVCAEIRSLPEGVDVPVVMMTGLEDTDSLVHAFRQGATDFITKPINLETLPYRIQYIFKAGKAFQGLRASESKLTYAQKIARMGSWEWEIKQDVVTLSDSCIHILGLQSPGDVKCLSPLLDLFHSSERERFSKALADLVENGIALSLDCRFADCGEEPCYFHITAEAHRSSGGEVTAITGTFLDISKRVRAEEKVRYLAYYDSLTGLPNRALFKEHLKRALDTTNKHKNLLAVLFIDLDRFKGVNDSMGHDAGDTLLQAVAHRIQRHVRAYDTVSRVNGGVEVLTVSRLGGDEFTILIEGIKTAEMAGMVARRLISRIESPFLINSQEVFISASIGISMFPHDGSDAESLLKYADIAMYSAKAFGRGAYKYYRPEMNEISMKRLRIEKHLRRALDEGALGVVFQPQVDSNTNRIVAMEALVRWDSGELGVVPPDLFVSVAEEAGLVIALDHWVLKTVSRQLLVWQAAGFSPEYVSVNLSAKHFQKKYLQDSLKMILDLPQEIQGKIGVEITERILMENSEDVISSLQQIADSNVNISLDDFGTGYSSLSYLAQIPCHTLKIDKSFIRKINIDQKSMNIIIGIIALAKSLNKKVVAEGVETREQLEFLNSHGCHLIQGYLYSKPLYADSIEQLFCPEGEACGGGAFLLHA